MLRYAMRRFYIAVIGLMLLSLPLFAAMRAHAQPRDPCSALTIFCDQYVLVTPPEHRPWSHLIWQTGLPPNDYWPIAVALLAAEGAATLLLVRRRGRLPR